MNISGRLFVESTLGCFSLTGSHTSIHHMKQQHQHQQHQQQHHHHHHMSKQKHVRTENSKRVAYSLCHHECQDSGDFSGLDHIRLPRPDTDQLVSAVRMRRQRASVKRFLCSRPSVRPSVHSRPEQRVRELLASPPALTDGGRTRIGSPDIAFMQKMLHQKLRSSYTVLCMYVYNVQTL